MFVRCIPLLFVVAFCWTMAAQCENHVVIVGGGLAGLSAAVEAIIGGAKVTGFVPLRENEIPSGKIETFLKLRENVPPPPPPFFKPFA